jgi:hypothetical protein
MFSDASRAVATDRRWRELNLKTYVIIAAVLAMIGAVLGSIHVRVSERQGSDAAAVWAVLFVGGLIALALLGQARGMICGTLAAAAWVALGSSVCGFVVVAADGYPLRSYQASAILFVGGLIALAIVVEKPLPMRKKTALESLTGDKLRNDWAGAALEESAPPPAKPPADKK